MISNLPSLFTFMINLLPLLLLILPLTTSRPTIERLLAETISYSEEGADWTGTCSSGEQQSPIDIDTVSGTCDTSMVMDLTFSSGTQNITMYDDGFTFKGNWTNSSLYATDITGLLTGYQSLQFHFHSPSEHRIEGETYDLELHIVHKITDQFAIKGLQTRPLAVVSVLFQVDNTASANAFLTALNLTSNLGKATSIDMKTKLLSNLASPLTYYTYQGSLTTPPCNETVNWYVVETPMKMTSSQLTVFTNRFAGNSTFAGGSGNNREAQSLNDRVVKQGGAECEEQFVYFFSFVILFVAVNYFVFKLL